MKLNEVPILTTRYSDVCVSNFCIHVYSYAETDLIANIVSIFSLLWSFWSVGAII